MTKKEEKDARDAEDVIVEVLEQFTALNCCYNPGDKARFKRKDADWQVSRNWSRIITDPAPPLKGRTPIKEFKQDIIDGAGEAESAEAGGKKGGKKAA